MSIFPLSCLHCTLFRRQRTRGHTPRWMLYDGRVMTKRIIRHLPSTAKNDFIGLFLRRYHGHPPRRGLGPPIMSAARAECRSSRFRGRRDRVIIQFSCPSITHPTLGLTTHHCWPLEEHHYAEVFTVSASFKTDYHPLWRGILSPSTRADALRANKGLCLNYHEDNHSFKHRRHLFVTASGFLNHELDELGDDDAHRRWQARMVGYADTANLLARSTTI